MEKTKIILIEDQAEFAEKVKRCISNVETYCFLDHYYSCESAFDSWQLNEAHVILLDIGLPGMSGLEALPVLLERNPNANIIMLTVFEEDKNLFAALKAGAKGYLLKGDCFFHLENAIEQVMMGGMLFSPKMAQKILKHFSFKPFSKIKLTSKEKEVLVLLSDGLLKKEIADSLDIKYTTVDSHIKNIYRKLQVRSNVQAINKAKEEGLI